MAKAVVMPKPGMTVDECVLTKWHKKVGDMIKSGEMLFSYETDKASFDEASSFDGEILAIFYEEGSDVPALGNICVIGEKGENIDEFKPSEESKPEAAPTAPAPTAPATSAPPVSTAPVATAPAQTASAVQNGISPRAKQLALKNGVDPTNAPATGPNGRTIERDIRAVLNGEFVPTTTQALASAPVFADQDIPHSNIRKAIAKAMHASISNMAQLTLNSSFDATEIQKLRKSLKSCGDPSKEGITLNDMVLYAVVKTLNTHRNLNAHYYDDLLRVFGNVNLGLAVDTEKGLLVPKIMAANTLSLTQLSKEAKTVAKAAQSGSISPDLLSGGTFTVTNLGNLGIESFTPVINPPEVAILGVCGLEEKVKTVGGNITTYQSMGLSLTFDHRALDGAPAARFLKDLCSNLANFSALLVV